MSLETLRAELSSLDRQLVELIAERQRVVGEIGRSKQRDGRPTRDYEREKDVLETARSRAQALAGALLRSADPGRGALAPRPPGIPGACSGC